MSISTELSSDIAVAILLRRISSPEKREALKETVLIVHSVLQELDHAFVSNTVTASARAKALDERADDVVSSQFDKRLGDGPQ